MLQSASRSNFWTSAYFLVTKGVKIEYQIVMPTSPLDVTNVSSQLKQQPMISARVITVVP
jgi:hypothetical protein